MVAGEELRFHTAKLVELPSEFLSSNINTMFSWEPVHCSVALRFGRPATICVLITFAEIGLVESSSSVPWIRAEVPGITTSRGEIADTVKLLLVNGLHGMRPAEVSCVE